MGAVPRAWRLIVSLFSAANPPRDHSGQQRGQTPLARRRAATLQTPALNTKRARKSESAICYEQDSKDNDLVRETINEKLGFEIEWLVCPASEGWAAQEPPAGVDPTIDMFYLDTARMSEYLSKAI